MTSSGDSDDASYSKRKVAYVFSPEYIQTCDSLSKVPNRVSWNQDHWFSQILFIAKSAFLCPEKNRVCVLFHGFHSAILQASMVHSLIEA